MQSYFFESDFSIDNMLISTVTSEVAHLDALEMLVKFFVGIVSLYIK
jgi:hypothetical protein